MGIKARERTNLAIAFSGAIGTGKTSLSRAVADALGCSRVSFGAQVREEARLRGLDGSRESLQRLGEMLVLSHMESFTRSVLAQALAQSNEPLLIEGVRHVEVLRLLRGLVSPRRLYLIHIEVDQAARCARLATDVTAWDSHSTEVQVLTSLRSHSDLFLDGEIDLPSLCSTVVNWIGTLRS